MAAPRERMSPFASASGAAAARIASRPPFGAPPRHSPGRTHPPLAQLQFLRFLRPDLAGVTRFDLSRVNRAPRGPVVVPVEQWPRAARERFARPRAGTALAPHLDRIRNAPFGERDLASNNVGDNNQGGVALTVT